MEETEKIAVLRLTLWDFVPERLSEKGEEVFRHLSRFSPVVHGRDHGETSITMQPLARTMVEPMEDLVKEQVDITCRNCILWRTLQRIRFS